MDANKKSSSKTIASSKPTTPDFDYSGPQIFDKSNLVSVMKSGIRQTRNDLKKLQVK